MTRPHREIRVWSVGEDGSKAPFGASGVRVPLASGCWVAIDLHTKAQGVLGVDVAVRAPSTRFHLMPRLAIVPQAGDAAWILIGNGPGEKSYKVVPVEAPGPGTDIRELLSRATSGDPGELVLAQPDHQVIPARRFMMEYGDISTIDIHLHASPEALLVVQVQVLGRQSVETGVSFPCLGMSVHLRAANLVSFWFRELTATKVE